MLDRIVLRLELQPDRIEHGVLLNFERIARFVLHVHVRTDFIVPAQKSHVCRGLRSRPALHGDLRPGIVRLRCADLVGSVPVLQRAGLRCLIGLPLRIQMRGGIGRDSQRAIYTAARAVRLRVPCRRCKAIISGRREPKFRGRFNGKRITGIRNIVACANGVRKSLLIVRPARIVGVVHDGAVHRVLAFADHFRTVAGLAAAGAFALRHIAACPIRHGTRRGVAAPIDGCADLLALRGREIPVALNVVHLAAAVDELRDRRDSVIVRLDFLVAFAAGIGADIVVGLVADQVKDANLDRDLVIRIPAALKQFRFILPESFLLEHRGTAPPPFSVVGRDILVCIASALCEHPHRQHRKDKQNRQEYCQESVHASYHNLLLL